MRTMRPSVPKSVPCTSAVPPAAVTRTVMSVEKCEVSFSLISVTLMPRDFATPGALT